MEGPNPIDGIVHSLRELNRAFYLAIRKDVEDFGLTNIQFRAMRLLKQFPKIGLNELSNLMHSGASTASGIVERLVHAGLVLRERPDWDRRALVLMLSPAGEELLEQANGRIMRRLSPMLELSNADVEHMLRIHKQIIAILERVREEK